MIASGSQNAVVCCGVRQQFGSLVALDHLDLVLCYGSVVGLVGKNGAGKSTLCDLIAGLSNPCAGTVQVMDRSGRESKSGRSLVGYASQEVGLYPTLTARQNLDFFSKIAGFDSVPSWVVESLDLSSVLERRISQLSYGFQRRVHTAISLIEERPILVLDEPTAGVDPDTQEHILDIVKDARHAGKLVVYVTHRYEELDHICDHLVVLQHGGLAGSIDRDAFDFGPSAQSKLYLELSHDEPISMETVGPPATVRMLSTGIRISTWLVDEAELFSVVESAREHGARFVSAKRLSSSVEYAVRRCTSNMSMPE